ncbi:acyl-CoA thioesterase [Pseudoalteromonas rubra]|uniref:acyl-CoA thioesterase n=1 Tax=Pseudoalteromonas rubra TaxID=43658 RepID=UPI003D330262
MKMNKSLLSASVDIEVPFHDCDPMRVVWHGNYARYFEVARCRLLDKFDAGYVSMEKLGYMWPIIDLQVKYIGSARFGQVIEVTAHLLEYESRLKIGYEIHDKLTGQRLTKGSTVQVAVEIASQEMQFTTPQPLIDKLSQVITL